MNHISRIRAGGERADARDERLESPTLTGPDTGAGMYGKLPYFPFDLYA
jgi:hypothetical protein